MKKKKSAAKATARKAAPKKKNAPRTTTNTIGVQPLADRVLVKPLTVAEKTTSFGIIIPDSGKEKPEQGTVMAVGPGKYNEDGDSLIPVGVSVGDKVMFSKYGFDEVKVDGVEYYVISESSILAILK